MKKYLNDLDIRTVGGRYHIFRNGVDTGVWRTQPHTAAITLAKMQIQEPDAKFDFRQTMISTLVSDFDTIELVEPPEDEPTDEPVFYGVFKTE